jgi:ATP-dependent DNA helicase
MYHGTQDERAELRATRLQAPANSAIGNIRENVYRKGKKRPAVKFKRGTNTNETFPIIVTTYEICINDQKHLSGFEWKFIVVDEGHRLKNLDCKLIRELKSYKSANRMILTGTPLHVSDAECAPLCVHAYPRTTSPSCGRCSTSSSLTSSMTWTRSSSGSTSATTWGPRGY